MILCHSRKAKSDLNTCWSDVLWHADEPSHGGAHIFAFHGTESQRGEFEASVYGRHRLVWLDQSDLLVYGTKRFSTKIKSLIDFEQMWRGSVRPKDVRSPLILPECSFETTGAVSDTWKRAHRVRIGHDEIPSVASLIGLFRERHYSKGCWIDVHARRFDPGASRHGVHVPRERRWKFALEVPEGFHFDVQAERGQPFTIRDAQGAIRKYLAYTNVDCHGYVRGGK